MCLCVRLYSRLCVLSCVQLQFSRLDVRLFGVFCLLQRVANQNIRIKTGEFRIKTFDSKRLFENLCSQQLNCLAVRKVVERERDESGSWRVNSPIGIGECNSAWVFAASSSFQFTCQWRVVTGYSSDRKPPTDDNVKSTQRNTLLSLIGIWMDKSHYQLVDLS